MHAPWLATLCLSLSEFLVVRLQGGEPASCSLPFSLCGPREVLLKTLGSWVTPSLPKSANPHLCPLNLPGWHRNLCLKADRCCLKILNFRHGKLLWILQTEKDFKRDIRWLANFQECQGPSLDDIEPEKYPKHCTGRLDWSLLYPHPLKLKTLGTRLQLPDSLSLCHAYGKPWFTRVQPPPPKPATACVIQENLGIATRESVWCFQLSSLSGQKAHWAEWVGMDEGVGRASLWNLLRWGLITAAQLF